MTPKDFLENCKILDLKLEMNVEAISIIGESDFIEQARFELEHSQGLRDGVKAILRE